MAAAPPATASTGDKRKAAAEEKDPDFDLVRDFYFTLKNCRCFCRNPQIFMMESRHHCCAVLRNAVKNQAARRRQGSWAELYLATI
jgi:hypothetical protein